MDQTLTTLKRVTDELASSAEWRELNREFLVQLEQAEYLCGRGEQTTFSTLSGQDKVAAISKATKALEDTAVYRDMMAKVSRTLDRTFCFREGSSKLSGDAAKDASRACGHLLERWPNLVSHLKRYLNHPLPPEVRVAAWRARLIPHKVHNDPGGSLVASNGLLAERSGGETRLCQACETILRSKPVYAALSDSIGVLKAMKGVALLSHRANPGYALTDTDLLICIPFLYARREELGRHSHGSDGVFLQLVTDIADQYEAFVRIRPMTMTSTNEAALDEFESQVKQQLSIHDPALQRFLTTVLQHEVGLSSKSLKNLIQPFVQRMFVGDVSMEVLCYVWDQCFIGMDTVGYQCLPYITVTWLILLRERLMSCTLYKDVEMVLTEDSEHLAVWHFQREMANRFLPALSASLHGGVVMSPGVTGTRAESMRTSNPAMTPNNTLHPQVAPTNASAPPETTSDTSNTSAPPETTGDTSERAVLAKRIAEMENELKLKQRQLESALARERRREQQGEETTERPPRVARATRKSLVPIAEHPASREHDANSLSTVATPLVGGTRQKQTITSQSATSSFAGIHLDTAHTTLVPRRGIRSVSENTDRSTIIPRLFSPSHLTTKDAQDIWIRIFARFTEAANILCHGENTDRGPASS